ncbi:ABC transporter permease subunit [Natronobeatus ordinarius]|uniref:ABC transporter permease subunit n=1 Tax=Natronobeatus ordinarius TaxID=2963433 RepID=UPI0020CFB4D3|nr:ABC transporter permease subunit [Natronobeatus ordinarius]
MSWVHVARKDFEDASRSLLLWALTGLLILLVAGLSTIPYLLAESGTTPAFEEGLAFLYSPIGFLIPIIGLVVGYRSIVGERESGTIRFLLGLPNTRRDVLVGKVLGRAGVVAVPTAIGFVVGALVIAVLYEGFDVLDYVGLFLFSLVMGLVYVAIAVGISASVRTRAKALGLVITVYAVFDMLWATVPMTLYWVLENELPGFDGLPAWYLLLERLSPGEALGAIALTLVDFAGAGDFDLTAAGRVAGEAPFYLENWFAWVIVGLWIAVPLGIGYLRFRRATLN